MVEPEMLRLYGEPSRLAPLAWAWVDEQLAAAGTYWVVARSRGHPHPRPVWGIWRDRSLHLSIGSPTIINALRAAPAVTIHLDSGTDVVIVEGHQVESTSAAEIVAEYEQKYGRAYDPAEYGPLTTVAPSTILAWRTAGWAGQESFLQGERWRLD